MNKGSLQGSPDRGSYRHKSFPQPLLFPETLLQGWGCSPANISTSTTIDILEARLSEMQPTARFLQACRITLFTRANCSLCTNAKHTLSAVWDTRPFAYKEIDVMTPEGKVWRDLYEFDTPVVRLSCRLPQDLELILV